MWETKQLQSDLKDAIAANFQKGNRKTCGKYHLQGKSLLGFFSSEFIAEKENLSVGFEHPMALST